MQGPDNAYRANVARMIDGLSQQEDPERGLEEILSGILAGVGNDPPALLASEGDAYNELAAVETWVSLASHAVQAVYAPSSPSFIDRFKKNKGQEKLAGWTKVAANKLRQIAEKVRESLRRVAQFLKGVSFSVGVNFPWGVSISVAWGLVPSPKVS